MCRVKARWINSLGIAVVAAGLGVATAARCCAMVPLSDAELARIEGGNKIWQCKAVDCCADTQLCCIAEVDGCRHFGDMCSMQYDYCQKKECHPLYRCDQGNQLSSCSNEHPYPCITFWGGTHRPGQNPSCVCEHWCEGTMDVGCVPQ